MEIIPALDLRGGRCVRLYQGDYGQETVFSEDPVGVAVHWQALGASRLHLVDLDGAAGGEPANLDAIKQILSAVTMPIQLGGGLRLPETIEQAFEMGIERVILGTVAVEKPEVVEEACRRFGQAIVIAIDARQGRVASHGWRRESGITASEMAKSMAELGAKRFIYTDIARDGTLSQPNFDAIAQLVAQTELPIIASGGVSRLSHLKKLAGLGVEGAIVGKALYTGDIDLKQALAAIRRHKGAKSEPTG